MKKIFFLVCLLVLWMGSAFAQELRGAWIHSPVGIAGWGWDKTVKALADNGFNAIFANLSWTVCSDYPSQVSVARPSLLQKDGSCRDCLQECLDACRKYGIQLHVWVVVCNMGESPLAVRELYRNAGRTQVDKDGKVSDYLSPQLAANRQLLAEVLTELVQKYDIDGVHLDYIRYPFGDYDCSVTARKDFEKKLGRAVAKWPEDILKGGCDRAAYRQWCRENVTGLLKAGRDAVKAASPKVQFSVAVYGHWPSAMESVAQDAAGWVDKGLVDFLCPMNYSGKPEEARGWLQQQLDVVQGRVPIYSGLANYMCEAVHVLEEEIQDTRKFGADGFICFQLKENLAKEWLPVLKADVTSKPSEAPVAYGQPRPTWKWTTHRSLWDYLAFWRDKPVVEYDCQMQMTGMTSRPTGRVELLRDGETSGLPMEIKWNKGTLHLKVTPSEGGCYRWKVMIGDNTWFSTTLVVSR